MSQLGDILARLSPAGLKRATGELRGRPSAGFTLIEVLLAVSILAVITSIMWISVSNMFRTRDFMNERFERYQIMRVSMDRMARELASTYLAGPEHGGEPLPGEEEEAKQAQAESGSSQRMREPVQFGMIGRDDTLNFTTFAHIRTLAGEKASQHAEIGYFTERHRNDEGELVTALMRREDTTVDDDITDGGRIFTMIPNVEEVKFEFWDPGRVKVGTMEEMAEEGRWVDSWDTTRSEFAGRLPTRVRIQVTLPPMDERGREETFTIQSEIGATEVLEF